MKVYPAEEGMDLDGRLTLASVATLIDNPSPSSPARFQTDRAKASANPNQPDLAYLNNILVSVGWNLNDDVFTPKWTWAARYSPEDKPVNYEHDGSDIIGHTAATWAIDENQNRLADDLEEDKLPSKFHLVTADVLYRYWADPDLQTRMDTILTEIAAGQWCVSMEVLFTDFDYALIDPDGTQRVVARNRSTAHITKCLKAYGGSGVYAGSRVGRLLKDLVFCGKGLVKNPANPDSIILSLHTVGSENFNPQKNVGYSFPIRNLIEGCSMDNVEALTAKVKELEAENAKLQSAVQEKWKSKAEEAIAALDAAKTAHASELKLAEEALASARKQAEEASAAVEVAREAHKKAQAELDKLTNEAKLAGRQKAVQDATKCDEATAKTMAGLVSKLTDEEFALHVQSLAKFAPAPTKAADPAVILDKVEVKVEPDLTTAGKVENNLKSEIAQYLNREGK